MARNMHADVTNAIFWSTVIWYTIYNVRPPITAVA